MPEYQVSLGRGKRRKTAENILKVKEISCNNQITRLIDGIAPGEFDWNFRDGLGFAEKYGVFEQYSVPAGGVLIALDGVWYHSSEKARCGHCLRLTKNGETTYYRSMTAVTIVRPGGDAVLPPAPEMIRNEAQGEEGAEGNYEKQKQNCERKAAALRKTVAGLQEPFASIHIDVQRNG
jgi:hypothetical protein